MKVKREDIYEFLNYCDQYIELFAIKTVLMLNRDELIHISIFFSKSCT